MGAAARTLAMLAQMSNLKTSNPGSSVTQNNINTFYAPAWGTTHEKNFNIMKEKFSKNPKATLDANDIKFINLILDRYIKKGDIFYYKKLAELLDICFQEALKTLPSNMNTRTAIEKSNWINTFPLAKKIEQFVGNHFVKRRTGALAQKAFETFKAQVGKVLPKETLQAMEPRTAMAGFHSKTIPVEHRKGRNFDYSKNYMPYSDWFDNACSGLVTEKDEAEIIKLQEESNKLTDELIKLEKMDQTATLNEKILKINKELEEIANKIQILKKENLINDLKSSTQEIFNSQSLYGLLQMYGRADFEWLGNMPEFAFQCDSGPLLYPDTKLDDIFPGTAFRGVMNTILLEARIEIANEQKAELERNRLMEENFKKSPEGIFASQSSIYREAWRVTKTQGAEPGFLLKTPEGRVGYAKSRFEDANKKGSAMPPSNIYYASSMLSHLGIKMAEPTLMGIKGHGFVFLTEDLSRTYKKANVTKKKKFSTMDVLLPSKKNIWGGSFMAGDSNSKEAMDKFLKWFNDPAQEKTRISFAKLMLATTIFGLSDVFEHGANIGIIETEKNGKKYHKFGLVDFGGGFGDPKVLEDLNKGVSITEILTRNIYTPIYKEMAKCISPQDLEHAAAELKNIKKREINPEGYLVVKDPKEPKVQEDVQASMQNHFKTIMFNLQKQAKEYYDPVEKESEHSRKIVEDDQALLVKGEKLIEETLKGVCDAILEPKARAKAKK